ncbi:hypothetical protein, partial [Algoriphagus sp.]|uniref:hypothetical protein n=1 Tax=Algoriphagus sp. TaxID=1872435 RepID=UPI002579552E
SSIPTAWRWVCAHFCYLAKIPTGLDIPTMFIEYLAGTVIPVLIGNSAPALEDNLPTLPRVSPEPVRLWCGY